MTTATTSVPMPRPAPSAPPSAPTIDLVKIVKQYLWWLVLTFVVGIAVGTGVFFALRHFAPKFQSGATFQAKPVREDLSLTDNTNTQELDRFMATQVAIIRSEAVATAVAQDPQVQNNAREWAGKFKDAQGAFDLQAAREDLMDRISASVVPQTTLLRLSVGYRTREGAYALAQAVREKYLIELNEQSSRGTLGLRTEFDRQIRDATDRIRELQQDRSSRLEAAGVDSIDEKASSVAQQISAINTDYAAVRLDIEETEALLDRYRQQLEQSAGAIQYPDAVINEVENEGIIYNIRSRINDIEAQTAALRQQGYGAQHRSMLALDAQRESWLQELEIERQKLLRQRFDALVDQLEVALSTQRAKEADLIRRLNERTTERSQLMRLTQEIDDLQLDIDEAIRRRADAEARREELRGIISLPDSARISVAQYERLPDSLAFPRPIIIIPAVTLACVGLVFGLIFLREMLDQRVKSPSDIAMARTRVLGVIPDGDQTPEGAGDAHKVFRDSPNGVLAESIRQVRAPLIDRMRRAGHKSVTVLAGNPGSGATMFATNLAIACAAVGQKVLLIDANFRRPRLHAIFNTREAPGLADALAGAPVHEAVQSAEEENLDLLAAGTGSLRIVERLASEDMARLLAEATATYDLVIVDVPPVVVSGDAKAIANRTDAAILVVRAFGETRGFVGRIRGELEQARGEFLGVVVNRVRAAAGGYLKSNLRATHEYASAKKG